MPESKLNRFKRSQLDRIYIHALCRNEFPITYRLSDGSEAQTGRQGEFDYYPGDIVEFFVGDVSLGVIRTPSEPQFSLDNVYRGIDGPVFFPVTPLNLTGKNATNADRAVVNKLIFLQTLDDDGNPDNGIRISAAVRDAFGGIAIDFDQSTDDFSRGEFAAVLKRLNDRGLFRERMPRLVALLINA